jgi:hypothetical protein
MRLFLAVLLMLCSVVSVEADNRFRRANRFMPMRNWRVFDGYNQRFSGYDSSYYTPYTTTNTEMYSTGIPTYTAPQFPQSVQATEGWQSTPNTTLRSVIQPEPTPDPTTWNQNQLRIENPTNTIPTINNTHPTTITPTHPITPNTPTTTTPTTSTSTRSISPRQSYPTNFQMRSTTPNYWGTFDHE